jgi:tRNA dimethylallyltransferase
LHDLLKKKDPAAAERIHPNNVRYVIRALEINEVSKENKKDAKGEPDFATFIVGIDWPREVLYDRINQRVDELMECGLLNEVKTLLMRGYKDNLPALSSIGYYELIQYIKGELSYEEAVEKIKQNTRNYCKRQLTWFRRYNTINWVNGEALKDYLQSKK